jgi:hypothetical protein
MYSLTNKRSFILSYTVQRVCRTQTQNKEEIYLVAVHWGVAGLQCVTVETTNSATM